LQHHLGFVHRDIKAENVLVVTDEYVKLGDFGFSTQITEAQHLNTFCGETMKAKLEFQIRAVNGKLFSLILGSPPYSSPELFNDDHYFGKPVDIWAMGILLYFILIGNMPFSAPTVPQLRTAILKGQYRFPGKFSTSCSKFIRE
jgi:serine/threonine protein kinase